MFNILVQNRIIGYFRYVDDILIVYNDSITNIHDVFNSFNNLTRNIKFTMEKETDNSINFLDVTIQKEHDTRSMYIGNRPQLTPLSLEIHAIYSSTNTQPYDIRLIE
jgi:GTPase SAR1 family protein